MKILITGGNRGIGKAIAEQLLIDNHEVLITSRDLQKGKVAIAELKEKTGKTQIEVIEGDLSDIQRCLELVEQLQQKHQDIQCLITNAGVWMTEKKLNTDGLEVSFMVNYLAPYILWKGLLPILQKNQPSRIVSVNSGMYIKGKLDLEKTPKGEDFHPIRTYATSKLCTIISAIQLAEEIQGTGVTINSVHPGVIKTGLGDSEKLISKIVKFLKRFWKEPAYGAIAPVWLATSDELNGISGKYFDEKKETEFIDQVKDENLRNKLINLTESLL